MVNFKSPRCNILNPYDPTWKNLNRQALFWAPHTFQRIRLETGGRDAYVAEVHRVQKIETGVSKKGVSKGKYVVLRDTLERAHEMEVWNELRQLASAKNMHSADLC